MVQVLSSRENKKLYELLVSKSGLIMPVSFDVLKAFTQEEISVFCHKHAVYRLPVLELLDFLKTEIGDRIAMEIGAGNGCIGRNLGIKMVDNHMQTFPEIRDHYKLMRQPTITYGNDVQRMDAIQAVKKYRPEVVIGCWITNKQKGGLTIADMYGIDEEMLFSNGVKKYIMVGNLLTHFDKVLLSTTTHTVYQFPWLVSRSMSRDKNIIFVFEK